MSTIQELFARDPLELTKSDIREIVKVYRENRVKFQLGNMSAGKAPAKKTPTQAAAQAVTGKLDLSKIL